MKRSLAIIAVIMLLPLISAQAQPQIPGLPEFKEVKGKYVNEELGIEITLPSGWSGIEFPSIMLLAGMEGGFIASPQGFDITGSPSPDAPVMILKVYDAKKMTKIKAEPPSESLPQTQPREEPTEPTTPKEPACKVLSYNIRTISGASGIEGVVECTVEDENGNPMQVRMKGLYISQETDDSIRTIRVGFAAKVNEYDKYIQDFDNALNTLKISDAKPLVVNLENESIEKVMIEDSEVEVKIKSNSEVSNFQFNEEDKSITFKVEGEDGSIGTTEVYLSNLLEGPYTVTIDGEPIEAIQVVDEEGNEGVKILYMHSVHEIKVTGTQVVPEFPIALPILAVITSIAIFMARSRSLI